MCDKKIIHTKYCHITYFTANMLTYITRLTNFVVIRYYLSFKIGMNILSFQSLLECLQLQGVHNFIRHPILPLDSSHF